MDISQVPPASRIAPSEALGWRLTLLGTARLVVDGAQNLIEHRLERKTAALLAFLALEGSTPRSRLAGMLWSDRGEERARANLRQCLRRLRGMLGAEIISINDTLSLAADCVVDAIRLESLVFTGEYEKALQLEGILLGGFDFDDTPELEEWVLSARERLEALRREALAALADRFEREQEFTRALDLATRLLERDTVSEHAHRRVMRLHYLRGDRSGALSAFERCRETLSGELGLEPLPQTLQLAQLIESGASPTLEPIAERPSIPLSVLRPQTLAGREHEWAQLEAAWEARQVVFISGVPGSGKTRLMLDFAGSKGGFSSIEGRSGDVSVAYSTHARNLKRTLSALPEVLGQLEPWVRRELSRLLPELEPETPTVIHDETEKLRFFQAIAHLTQRLSQHGYLSIVLDDLQFMDAGSFEVGTFIASRSLEAAPQFLRSLNAFRSHELTPEVESRIHELVDAGHAVLIELKPLAEEAVGAMLGGIDITNLERHAPALTQYTGGNPMFIVETIKHLIETNQMSKDFPTHLPPPGKVGPLIRRRLERLTPNALRVAQVAAVAETDFTPELAAAILELGAFDLSVPFAELEMAQVLVGTRFVHDLIFEATLEGVPNTIRTLLHQRIAEYLEGLNAAPARIAHHWLEVRDCDRAVPFMIVAAEAAQRMTRDDEAIGLLQRAIALPVAAAQRHRAQAMLAGIYVLKNRFEDAEHSLKSLLEVVSDPEAHWLTLDHLCYLHISRGSLETAQHYGERALELASLHGVASRLEDTRYKLGVIAHNSGENQRAVELILPAVTFWREQPANINFLNALGGLGSSLYALGRTDEALLYEDEMLRHAKALGADRVIVNHLSNILYRDFLRGDASEAISNAQNLLTDLEQRGSNEDVSSLRNNLAAIYARLERPDDAIVQYTKLTTDPEMMYHLAAWANLAVLHAKQAQPAAARHALNRALALAPDNDYPTARFALIRAVYTLGTADQRAQIQPYLNALNFAALPANYRTELEALLETVRVADLLNLL